MLIEKKIRNVYIRLDNRKYEKNAEKYLIYSRKIFIKVKLEFVENGIIILIPKYKTYNKFITKLLLYQLNFYIKKLKPNYLIFEEKLDFLKQDFDYKNILNSKYIMKKMLLEILQYIFKINKQNMNLENIYIFVNKYSKSNIYIINNLVANFKTVNIITENLKEYKRLEDSFYNQGTLITVSNNKRKSAKNAKYIVNIDFEKEIFERYNINMNAIIINLTNEKIFFKDIFQGVLVNNFEIIMNKDFNYFVNEFYGNIDKKMFIESYLLCNDKYDIDEIMMNYGIKIKGLIGVRGTLQDMEIARIFC